MAVETIGILTSGGDAPGMNACIRGVARTAFAAGKRVVGIRRGYAGLLDEDIFEMNSRSVSDIIQRGGTVLFTARSKNFKLPEYQDKGAEICRKHGIDSMVVIGGDGSFQGAGKLAERGINTIALPGTIDNDIACTDYTIGFDTAVNTAMECIDKIRDTSTSHERCNIIEVMGRGAGYIALWCGIANGSEEILTAETFDGRIFPIVERIRELRARGKKHYIIINAESIGNSQEMAKLIQLETGMDTRATVLGHIQRGGSPTAMDRVYGSLFGAKAVDLLMEGKSNRVVGLKGNEFVDYDIADALVMKKEIDPWMVELGRRLVR